MAKINFRSLITINEIIETVEDGIKKQCWQECSKHYSQIENKMARTSFSQIGYFSDNQYKFTLRYSNGISKYNSITYKDKHFAITEVNNVNEENKIIEINATELVLKTCTVIRDSIEKDTLNRPTRVTKIVGEYPCYLFRKYMNYTAGVPNTVADETYILVSTPSIDIQAGDIVEIDNVRYISTIPFKPTPYKTEIEITVKKDI